MHEHADGLSKSWGIGCRRRCGVFLWPLARTPAPSGPVPRMTDDISEWTEETNEEGVYN